MSRKKGPGLSSAKSAVVLFCLGVAAPPLAGCEGRSVVGGEGPALDLRPAHREAGPAADTGVAPDTAAPVPDSARPDMLISFPDAEPCICSGGEVWRMSSCLPTDELGCGAGCSSTASCASGWTCAPCAATTSCISSTCESACVPSSSAVIPSSGLRISPTNGTVYTKTTLTIEGAAFVVGALYYNVRMGGTTVVAGQGGASCTLTADMTPSTVGIFAVEVSQYGGGAPWALAGFFTAHTGGITTPTAQPGFPCSAGLPCAEASPYLCTCTSGKCACK